MSNDTYDDGPFAPKPQQENKELIPEKDLDEWLKAKMEKRMCGQDKESEEDALIDILKSLVRECKAVYTNKSAKIETSSRETNEVQGVSFVADDEEGDISRTLSFRKLANLKETNMELEMDNMTKKAPLGTVRYKNKNINDTTREKRYYEWDAHNSEFDDNVLNKWVLDSFDVKAEYGKTRDDPYSRRKRGMPWMTCGKNTKISMGASYPWHDEGFEEEERWESGIEKADYELPFVDIETFKIKRFSQQGNVIRVLLDLFSCGKKAPSLIGCAVMPNPFRYLGVMVGDSMSQKLDWADTVQKLRSWLSMWKVKTLSTGDGSLWYRVIQALYGASFELHLVNQSLIWCSILHEMQVLMCKGLDFVSHCSITLFASKDRWICDLNGDGVFRVKEVRTILDDIFLPSTVDAIRWVKYIPIKINVFAWRARLDRLPTRSNLVRRGVVLDFSLCPLCGLVPEDIHHVLFRYDTAKLVFRRICR
nr:RNA-directed DNA polymerase, eukaryota [Tanacetum cinerariifolium]